MGIFKRNKKEESKIIKNMEDEDFEIVPEIEKTIVLERLTEFEKALVNDPIDNEEIGNTKVIESNEEIKKTEVIETDSVEETHEEPIVLEETEQPVIIEEMIFEAYYGGYFGPSSYYYVEQKGDEYLFKYGYSKDGNKNPDLKIIKKDKSLYEQFIIELKNQIKEWENEYTNDIIDGTQWHINLLQEEKMFTGSNKFPSNFDEVISMLDTVFEAEKNEEVEEESIKIEHNDNDESIKLFIKNNNSNYVLMLKKYKDYCNILFVDKNKMENTYMPDIIKKIEIEKFYEYKTKILKLIKNWEDKYIGNSGVIWGLNIETNELNKSFNGNGNYPTNWNDYIDLISEYEILFKKTEKSNEKNVDLLPKRQIKYDEAYIEKCRSEIKNDVDNKLIEMGLLRIKDGKRYPTLGSANVASEIEKKLLKEKYNIDINNS